MEVTKRLRLRVPSVESVLAAVVCRCLASASLRFFCSWSWRCRRDPCRANSVAIATPCLPPSAGFNFQLRACLKVSSSSSRLPLERATLTLVTLP